MTTEQYNLWSLILQLLIWTAMIATFIVYFSQLRAMQRGAVGQNIVSLVNFLQAPYVRDARRTVRASLKAKLYEHWTEKEKRDASLVCSTYDAASILIYRQGLVPPDPFIKNWGASIKDCYEICKDHITEMQKEENSGPLYWTNFVVLYNAVMTDRSVAVRPKAR